MFFLKIAVWMTVFILTASLGRLPSVRHNLPLVFIIGGLGACSMGFLFWVSASHREYLFTSTFYQSDVFAGYLLLLIPLAGSFALFSLDTSRRFLFSLVTFVFVISLFLTGSRGGLFVFFVIVAVWGFLVSRQRPKIFKTIAFMLSLFGLGGVLYLWRLRDPALIGNFITKIKNPFNWFVATHARFSFWKGGLRIFARHPWFGSGLDTYGRVFPMFQEKFYWYSRYPHNAYIQFLSDGGIFATIFFVALIGAILYAGFRAMRQWDSDSPLTIGLWVGFLAGALHLFLDVDSNFLTWSVLFWAYGGLLAAYAGKSASDTRPGRFLKFFFVFLTAVFLSFQVLLALAHYAQARAEGFMEKKATLQALTALDEAIRFFPRDSSFYEQKSHLEFALYQETLAQKWLFAAQDDLKEALRIDPVRPMNLGELAGVVSYFPRGPATAESLLKQSLRLDPWNYPLQWVQLADLFSADGNVREAKAIYQGVLNRYPENDIARLPSFRQQEFKTAVSLARGRLSPLKNVRP